MTGFELFAATGSELSVSIEPMARIAFLWIGFGAIAGICAQIILPGGDARPAVVTVLIGLMGAVLGPLLVASLMQVDGFYPISPLGMGSAVLVSFCLLALFRTTDLGFRAYVRLQDEERKKKKKKKSDDDYDEE